MGKPNNDWRAIVTAYKTSGQKQTEWCRANNVNLSNLRYWLQKEKNKKASTPKETCQWLTLNLSEQEHNPNQNLNLHIGPIRIEVNPGFDPQFLADVIRSLITIC